MQTLGHTQDGRAAFGHTVETTQVQAAPGIAPARGIALALALGAVSWAAIFGLVELVRTLIG